MACTGCGRCIDACPVNIDITEILGCLAEVAHE
ncbi:MAG: 4Fe-4S binding protein [Anaerolineales bacterium]